MQGNFGARIWTGKNIWTFMCVCIARYTLYIYVIQLRRGIPHGLIFGEQKTKVVGVTV